MAQAAEKVLEFPAGGIADFYMEDDDIAKMEKEEARKAFGDNGIANFSDVANRMASYGRGGDDTLAHVATGEIVIPLPLIDNNPEMKASIFKHLEELGVEDPEQYVVGSSANSINPETGLREFGWLSKTIRKVTRGVKKAVKSVVKVVKKAAPVIIPFALNALFPGMGAIYSGALGAGIGTLVQGGSLKDAFKSALIGGAMGGAIEGVKGALPGGKGAMASIKDAAKFSRLQEAGTQLTTGQFGQSGLDAVRASAPSASSELIQARNIGQNASVRDAFAEQGFGPRPAALSPEVRAAIDADPKFNLETVESLMASDPNFKPPVLGADGKVAFPKINITGAQSATVPYEKPSFFKSLSEGEFKEAFFPSGPDAAQLELAKQTAYNNTFNSVSALPGATSEQAAAAGLKAMGEVTAASMGPGMIASYAPIAGVGLAGAAALGAFDTPDDPEAPNQQTGADLIAQNPDDYLLPSETPAGATGPVQVASRYNYDPSAYLRYRPVYGGPVSAPPNPFQRVAEGGEIFPRRVGGIMPDEGVPGKDSVRAMLMPGEFVMTTDAVRGLGNGNNDQGIRNMYDMMRGLEAKGRAMA
jgi:hypothetical protein